VSILRRNQHVLQQNSVISPHRNLRQREHAEGAVNARPRHPIGWWYGFDSCARCGYPAGGQVHHAFVVCPELKRHTVALAAGHPDTVGDYRRGVVQESDHSDEICMVEGGELMGRRYIA
jgi:hypothetical protein